MIASRIAVANPTDLNGPVTRPLNPSVSMAYSHHPGQVNLSWERVHILVMIQRCGGHIRPLDGMAIIGARSRNIPGKRTCHFRLDHR